MEENPWAAKNTALCMCWVNCGTYSGNTEASKPCLMALKWSDSKIKFPTKWSIVLFMFKYQRQSHRQLLCLNTQTLVFQLRQLCVICKVYLCCEVNIYNNTKIHSPTEKVMLRSAIVELLLLILFLWVHSFFSVSWQPVLLEKKSKVFFSKKKKS